MTMQEMKPTATTFFNTVVTDTDAQQYFADAFDLWSDCDSLYDGSDNGYKAIIRRFAQPINEEVARIRFAMSDGATKRITATSGSTSHESGTTGKQSNSKQNTSHVENDGEFTQEARTYPTGYIESPDGSYIASQTIDSPYEQTDTTETEVTGSEDTTAEKDTTTAGTSDTEEIDELARASLLVYSARLAALIEGCVFKFVAGTVTGGFRQWH